MQHSMGTHDNWAQTKLWLGNREPLWLVVGNELNICAVVVSGTNFFTCLQDIARTKNSILLSSFMQAYAHKDSFCTMKFQACIQWFYLAKWMPCVMAQAFMQDVLVKTGRIHWINWTSCVNAQTPGSHIPPIQDSRELSLLSQLPGSKHQVLQLQVPYYRMFIHNSGIPNQTGDPG